MLNELARVAYEVADKRGKYPKNIQFTDIVKAMHSEIEEFAEAFYLGKTDFKKDSVEWELMDYLLIGLSVAHRFNIDVDKRIRQVIEYNKRR